MPFGGFAGAIGGALLGGVGSIISGNRASSSNARQAALDRAFQKEVYQNQLQWKAADAKKAGLHPLSVIGTGSYSPSPSSVPSSGYPGLSDSLGKLGEGIGDAFTAYMNKDEIAAQAADKLQRDNAQSDAQIRATNAQASYYEAMALNAASEPIKRAMSYTIPMASGREVIPGQTNAPKDLPLPSARGLGSGQGYNVTPLDRGYALHWSPELLQGYGDEIGQLFGLADVFWKTLDSLIFGTEYMGMRVSRNDWNWYPANRVTKRSGRGYAHEVSGKLYR